MSRSPVTVRDACPDDAAAVLRVWRDLLPRLTDRVSAPAPSDAGAAVARDVADPRQRLLVAEQDGVVIGAASLSRVPLSPVHLEEMVQVTHLYVVEEARRHGAARLLIGAAVSWAEEVGAVTVSIAAQAHDREANRYLARLGFSAVGVFRAAAVTSLRLGSIPLETPGFGRDMRLSRAVGHIVAQRRAQRRAQAPTL